jgi:ABC-2 type transport system ATP-binding protein
MLLKIENLSKKFTVYKRKGIFRTESKTVDALSGIGLEIKKPQILGIIGANGAGKTTLIKNCLGLVEPSVGSVEILGFTPHKLGKSFLEQVGFVSGQKQSLDSILTAQENLMMSGFMYNMDRNEIPKKIQELTKMFGVEDLLDTPIRQLSLGQKMKFEIISSVLHTPKILFMDEPTLGLDFEAQQTMRAFLKNLHKNHGVTIILTSHYLTDIKELCKNVIVLEKGVKVFDGTLKNLAINNSESEYLNKLRFELTK